MDFLCRAVRGAGLIPIAPEPEPTDFDFEVRQPGRIFLRTTPRPTNNQWRGKDYWRRSLIDLYDAYRGVCAYCGSWVIRPGTANRSSPNVSSVDHYVPKSVLPDQAYEWSNFRLCRARLNSFKDNSQDVIDPFVLSPGWIQLNFQSFLIEPNPHLNRNDRNSVKATIERLRLNTDNDYVNERSSVIHDYCLGEMTLVQLKRRYPFIASEMIRQDFDTNFLPSMKAYFSSHP